MEIITINYIGHIGITSSDIVNYLEKKSGDDIFIDINSLGGEEFEGLIIYNTLKSYIGDIKIIINSLAAGIASVIAMAGDEIFMTSKSYIVIKNPCTYNTNGSTFSNLILDSIKSLIIDTYISRKLSVSRDQISKMMDDETYINADEALKYGFIDKIIE